MSEVRRIPDTDKEGARNQVTLVTEDNNDQDNQDDKTMNNNTEPLKTAALGHHWYL